MPATDVDRGVCGSVEIVNVLMGTSCVEPMLKLVVANTSVELALLEKLVLDNWLEILDRIEDSVKKLLEETD